MVFAHGKEHAGRGIWHELADVLIHAIIRGFGWRAGATAAEAFIHLFGVLALIIIAGAVVAYALHERRNARR
ncbi:hypothetical protein BKG71_22840 [Mycobacteroides chelonae]|nr:hypothetical protein BKG71_22840 [Mycobacteroides chelonae]